MKIAITGKMCSGKSTLASIISESNTNFKIYSFGKKVKDVAKDLSKSQTSRHVAELMKQVGEGVCERWRW